VTHQGEVHEGVRALGAEDILELALAQVDHVHGHVGREALPGHAVRAGDAVELAHAAGDQPALSAGDAGDEELLARLGAAPRPRLARRCGRGDVEEPLGALAEQARHAAWYISRRSRGAATRR
jgi:hypothetical protein